MILIQNGLLIDPKNQIEAYCDILIRDNKIDMVCEKITMEDVKTIDTKADEEDLTIIDAKGLIVAPGFIDVHVHFRDPGFLYKEDIYTGAKAAAKGGFTTVVLMANTMPTVDSVETLNYVLEKGRKTQIRVETCASVTKGLKGKELVDMKTLLENGAAGFTDDGIPICDPVLLKSALEEVEKLGVPISLHEEDPSFIQQNGINSKVAKELDLTGSPREAEISLIKRDLELAISLRAKMNVQHISTKEAVELIREAKEKQKIAYPGQELTIYAEATPHHFSLTEKAILEFGTLAKMNPPLRLEEDRLAIVHGLKDGTIDIIATDHAPHSEEEKAKDFVAAPSGILGLETAFSLAVTNLIDTGDLTIAQVIERMSVAPARLYNFARGELSAGSLADVVILDLQAENNITELESKSKNSPFVHQTLKGKVKYTICNGKVVYQD